MLLKNYCVIGRKNNGQVTLSVLSIESFWLLSSPPSVFFTAITETDCHLYIYFNRNDHHFQVSTPMPEFDRMLDDNGIDRDIFKGLLQDSQIAERLLTCT